MSEYDNSEPHVVYDLVCDPFLVDDLDCFVEHGSGSVSELVLPESVEYKDIEPTYDTKHTYHMRMIPVDMSDFDPTPVVGSIPHLKSYLNFTWSFE